MRSLHLVDEIQIGSPCHKDWNEMIGTDEFRHCSKCDHAVWNLSELNSRDIENLFESKKQSVCVRLTRREDGSVVTKDRRIRPAVFAKRIAFSLLAWFGLSLATGCERHVTTVGIPIPRTPPTKAEPVAEPEKK